MSRLSLEMSDSFKYIMDNYSEATGQELKNHPLAKFIRDDIVDTLYRESNLDREKYLIKGSAGQGQWATIPWIACFKRTITTSAACGYDIVYLFREDMNGFYLSLNQGWTYFEQKYGTKEGKVKIERTAKLVRESLNTVPSGLRESEIDLGSKKSLSQGYEKGHICGRYYDASKMPSSEELLSDLKSLIVTYQELENMMAGRTIEQFNNHLLLIDDNEFLEDSEREEIYQEASTEAAKEIKDIAAYKEDHIEPRPRKEATIDGKGKKSWPRSSKEAAVSLVRSNYRCCIDEGHRSFISDKTGQQFMELHHLVPMSIQDRFECDLDRAENIKSLCPNCHRAIHHARGDIKSDLIERLYHSSSEDLNSIGIEIDLVELKGVYGV